MLALQSPRHMTLVAPVGENAGASAKFSISLRQLSFVLPDGRPIFTDLNAEFRAERIGLVGRNGSGKSVLARVMVDLAKPTSGRVVRSGAVCHVPQQVSAALGESVAHVAGMGPLFDALARVEAGGMDACDDTFLDGHWDIGARFQRALAESGLGQLEPGGPADGLSGGELSRIALIGAFESGADGLVLDEPTNHLDALGREWLRMRLSRWRGGAIVVSHDRELLDQMDRIAELGSAGLRAFGGNFAMYAEQRERESVAADAALQRAQAERKAGQLALREQHDALQRRAARNSRSAKSANIDGLALGKRSDGAQASAGREQQRRYQTSAALNDVVRQAAERVQPSSGIVMMLPDTTVPAGKRVAVLEDVVPQFPRNIAPLNLTLTGPMRIAITGPNGSGKTTLLKMLAGTMPPASGRCQVDVRSAWLDQHADALLLGSRSVLSRLQELQSPFAEGELRSHLAWLGLSSAHVLTPAALLSGGERMKAALACALWAREPAQLLLLDEPTNHLDLASVQAMEGALTNYPGALVVVSHDQRFLDALVPTHTLSFKAGAWLIAPAATSI